MILFCYFNNFVWIWLYLNTFLRLPTFLAFMSGFLSWSSLLKMMLFPKLFIVKTLKMLTTERSHRCFYFLRTTLIIKINNLIRSLIDVFPDKLKVIATLMNRNRWQTITLAIKLLLIFIFTLEERNDSDHKQLLSLISKTVFKDCGTAHFNWLVLPDSLNYKNVFVFVKNAMRNFDWNAIFWQHSCEPHFIVVQKKGVFSVV